MVSSDAGIPIKFMLDWSRNSVLLGQRKKKKFKKKIRSHELSRNRQITSIFFQNETNTEVIRKEDAIICTSIPQVEKHTKNIFHMGIKFYQSNKSGHIKSSFRTKNTG